MPHVLPLDEAIPAQLTEACAAGADLCGTSVGADPSEVVAAIEAWATGLRERGATATRTNALNIGALLGEQFVRQLGWHWVELVFRDASVFAVLTADELTGLRPLIWAHDVLIDHKPIDFGQVFARAIGGDLPQGQVEDPTLLA